MVSVDQLALDKESIAYLKQLGVSDLDGFLALSDRRIWMGSSKFTKMKRDLIFFRDFLDGLPDTCKKDGPLSVLGLNGCTWLTLTQGGVHNISDLTKETMATMRSWNVPLLRELNDKLGLYLGGYRSGEISVVSYIEDFSGDTRDIIKMRLGGVSLEDIGRKYCLTRERVRQIIVRAFAGAPLFHEDKYRYVFEHYKFTLDVFSDIFGEPESTYWYLFSVRNKHIVQKNYTEAVLDEFVQFDIREKIKDYVDGGIYIDGVFCRKNCVSFMQYIVDTKCHDVTTVEGFEEMYDDFIREHGLSGDPNVKLNHKYCVVQLSRIPNVLNALHGDFRFYDFEKYDWERFYRILNLREFNDMEISSYLIYSRRSDLMREYDIRDEYELHNLIRKTWDMVSEHDVTVSLGKMPVIVIGNGDRARQVDEVWNNVSRKTRTAAGKVYSELYGFRADSACQFFACKSKRR